MNLIGLFAIWAVGIYIYMGIEGIIPTHFNIEGQADAYGSGDIFLFVLPALSIAPIIIMIITIYRFTLVNKHPYLINLPAFYAYLPKIPFKKRSYWLDKYFEAILTIGIFTTFENILILSGLYLGILEETLPNWFIPVILSMSFLIIVPLIYYLYLLSKKMKKAIQK